jgi:hypothetical protein
MSDDHALGERVIADTQRWLDRAVIGLNLCPFAKAVVVKGQVHVAVASGQEFADVLGQLEHESDALLALDPSRRDTTLLVVPVGFDDFLFFHQLVREAERMLARRKLEGVLQLASFHPQFVFQGADADDMANFSNRSPYPTLHLLREGSVERAVAAFPDAEAIFGGNMNRLRQLGHDGWRALGVGRT